MSYNEFHKGKLHKLTRGMSETENNYESTNYTNGFSPIPKTFDVLGRRLNGIKRLHQITFTTNKTKNTSKCHSQNIATRFSIRLSAIITSRIA